METRKLMRIALLGAVAFAAACSSASTEEDETQAGEDQLRPLERKAVGKAADYPADTKMRAQLETLVKSQKARREAAWKAVARALKPVKTAAKVDGQPATIPLFRTWYGKDDFERMFGKMYSELAPQDRKDRKKFTVADAKRAFEWNASSLGESSEKDYFDRISKVENDTSVQGLGGNHRVAYSPGFFEHLLGEYGSLYECIGKLQKDEIKSDDAPPSSSNFSPCFSKEFPADAALVKMSWYRANFGNERLPLPAYKSDAATLKAKMDGSSESGGWGKGTSKVDPDDSKIYTVALLDGTKFRMPAIHIVTKELRDWLWITLHWSENPDDDFGQDRPAEIKALGGPWSNYKMQVSVSFEEQDPDPRGGFSGSLGDSLAATYAGVGKPSWNSNPYLEKGANNAQTNCIGCHQHAGTAENSESILAEKTRFPQSGRTKLRKNFPVDYTWALTSAPERLATPIEDQIKHYDTVDR